MNHAISPTAASANPVAEPGPRFAILVFALIPLVLNLGSCCYFGRHSGDPEDYRQLPVTLSGALYRCLALSTPATRKRAFYGSYCGPGDSGGPPVDALDTACRGHDIAYWRARSRADLTEADRKFIEDLGSLEESELCPRAREFRRRALEWFSSPACRMIGKPMLPTANRQGDRAGRQGMRSRFARPARRNGG